MMQPYPRKNSHSQKQTKDEDKKQKQSLIKKLLIKNKIVSILSHQPRKLMKLAKKGNLAYKNMQQHTLLPKLTLKNLFPQIEDLNKKNKQHHEQFYEVNKQLTCSMLSFQNKFTAIAQQDQGKILNIQTQKCYSHIPSYFFAELEQQKIHQFLTRNKKQAEQKAFDLADYADEVEYNINQQVGYKMKVFMDFAFFLQGIAGLVDISCKKLKNYRARNNIVREIIVQKSVNINILRVKQNNLTKCILIVQQIKKVKHMQKSLMSLIHAKGKITIGDIYQEYCKQHEKVKQICCKRSLCNFGDIRYYVERNYQQTFNKSLQNYLGQLAKIDKQKLYEILRPSKAIYTSLPYDKNFSFQKFGQKASFNLDQSIEVEDQFQLIVKTNIETQISNIFQMGLQKCTYSTDNLCLYLKQQLQQLEIRVYSALLQNIQKPKEDMLDNFVNYALNRPTQSSLQINIDDKILSFVQKAEIINKISLPKFLQIAEVLSKKFMDLNIRCFSMINQLMIILKPLERKQPQKQQIISAYLIQLVIICIGFTNSCFGTFVNLRDIKESQIQMGDKIITLCVEWEQFLQEAGTKYEPLWRKLVFNLSDQPLKYKSPKLQCKSSFNELQQLVQLNYSTKQMQQLNEQDNNDVSQELINKEQITLKLLNEIIHAKNQKLKFNFYALTKLIINKELSKKIELESWTPISMNSTIQNSIGFIIYGSKYLIRQESNNDSKNFLSKSLLLDKSSFGKRKSQQSIPPPPDEGFDIQASERWIKIGDKTFKLIGITQYLLEIIYLFFLYYQKYTVDQENFTLHKAQKQNIPEKSIHPENIRLNLLIQKTIEAINIVVTKIRYYVNNLKDLQKKVKSFAKFLLLVYVQLDFFKTLVFSVTTQNIESRKSQSKDLSKSCEKQILDLRKGFIKQVEQCMNEIVKKYNSIGYQKIKQSVKKMQINPKKEIKIPSQTTSQILTYFSKSLEIIEDIIIDKRQFWKFLNCPWIKIYLQKINQQYSQVKKYVLKSNGSGSGRRIEEIQWEDKLDWKKKQLKWLLSAMQNQKYTQHIKDIQILQKQLTKHKTSDHIQG